MEDGRPCPSSRNRATPVISQNGNARSGPLTSSLDFAQPCKLIIVIAP